MLFRPSRYAEGKISCRNMLLYVAFNTADIFFLTNPVLVEQANLLNVIINERKAI